MPDRETIVDYLQNHEQAAEKYRDERDLLLEQRDTLFMELSDLKLRHAEVVAEECRFCDERIKTVDRLDAQVVTLSDALCITLVDNLRLRQLVEEEGS